MKLKRRKTRKGAFIALKQTVDTDLIYKLVLTLVFLSSLFLFVFSEVAGASNNRSNQKFRWQQVGQSLGQWRPNSGALAFTKKGQPMITFMDERARIFERVLNGKASVALGRAVTYQYNGQKWIPVGGALGKNFVQTALLAVSDQGIPYVSLNDIGINEHQKSYSCVYRYGFWGWSAVAKLIPKYILTINDLTVKNNDLFVLTTQNFPENDSHDKVIVYQKKRSVKPIGQTLKLGNTKGLEIQIDHKGQVYIAVLNKTRDYLVLYRSTSGIAQALIDVGQASIYRLDHGEWKPIADPIRENATSVSFIFSPSNQIYAVVRGVFFRKTAGQKTPIYDEVSVYTLKQSTWVQIGQSFTNKKTLLSQNAFAKPKIAFNPLSKLYLAFSKHKTTQQKGAGIFVYTFDETSNRFKQEGGPFGTQKSSFLDIKVNALGIPYVMFLNVYPDDLDKDGRKKVEVYRFGSA